MNSSRANVVRYVITYEEGEHVKMYLGNGNIWNETKSDAIKFGSIEQANQHKRIVTDHTSRQFIQNIHVRKAVL